MFLWSSTPCSRVVHSCSIGPSSPKYKISGHHTEAQQVGTDNLNIDRPTDGQCYGPDSSQACHVTWPSADSSQACHVTWPSAAYSLLPNCFSCARASSAACTTPTIRNWTPESDWKHKKHCQLIACCKQKRTESQSFQYHIHIVINHHWLLVWRNYNSLSLNLHEKAWVCFFFKLQVEKVPLISTVPALPGNMSGENVKCWSCDCWGESVFSCRKPQRLRMAARSTDAGGIDIK